MLGVKRNAENKASEFILTVRVTHTDGEATIPFPDESSFARPLKLLLFFICVKELNEVAAELCEHISLYGVPRASQPSAIVACVPTAMKVRERVGGSERILFPDDERNEVGGKCNPSNDQP